MQIEIQLQIIGSDFRQQFQLINFWINSSEHTSWLNRIIKLLKVEYRTSEQKDNLFIDFWCCLSTSDLDYRNSELNHRTSELKYRLLNLNDRISEVDIELLNFWQPSTLVVFDSELLPRSSEFDDFRCSGFLRHRWTLFMFWVCVELMCLIVRFVVKHEGSLLVQIWCCCQLCTVVGCLSYLTHFCFKFDEFRCVEKLRHSSTTLKFWVFPKLSW